ncbi:MAG: hypothetical protein ACREJ2_06045 [Planctomycetota bacterium]
MSADGSRSAGAPKAQPPVTVTVSAEDGPAAEKDAMLWLRPAAAVPASGDDPTLPAADPNLDGWAGAARLVVCHPGGSRQTVPSDTTVLACHHGGVLYLRIQEEWPADGPPPQCTTQRDGDIWQDDGIEIFLAPAEHLDRVAHLLFNWKGVQGDARIDYDPGSERALRTHDDWNPAWKVQVRRHDGRLEAEVALPLKELLGVDGTLGEVLRCDVVRNRVGPQGGEVHWSRIAGAANCRPDYFGFLLLAGPAQADGHPAPVHLSDLKLASAESAILPEQRTLPMALAGETMTARVLNPLYGLITPSLCLGGSYTVDQVSGPLLAEDHRLDVDGAVLTFTCRTPPASAGHLRMSVGGDVTKLFEHHFDLVWRRWRYTPAADADRFQREGRVKTSIYPRTVGEAVAVLHPGDRLTFRSHADWLAVRLPIAFETPGPWYGTPLLQTLRCQVDDGPWQPLTVAALPQNVLVADHLAPGEHRLTIEAVGGEAWFAGVTEGVGPFAAVEGYLLTKDFGELLTDARGDLLQDGNIVRSEYVRDPHDGHFELFGLAPGHYTLRLTAAGWTPVEKSFTVPAAGGRIDLGVVALARDPRCQGWGEVACPHFGRTLTLQPGASFTAVYETWGDPVTKAALVSRFRRIALTIGAAEPLKLGRFNGLVRLTFTLPKEAPFDLYDLDLTCHDRQGDWPLVLGEAAAVAPPLPAQYFLAGCGHMNTWGEQTSEYLAQVAAVAQLAGARRLLIANEVNAAYVSGGLADLRMPYSISAGNHTMGRWGDFFGDQAVGVSDGALRIVTFSGAAYKSWLEAETLLKADPAAQARVLLCFEGFAPIETIQRGGVKLIFDGHTEDSHPEAAQFPAGTRKLRAGTQDSLRWIPMDRSGIALAADAPDAAIPELVIPRGRPAPLRVECLEPNDGTQAEIHAKLIDEFQIGFDAAQLRFVLAHGKYFVAGGTIVQQFDSDDGRFTVVDVTAAVKSKSETTIHVRLAR